MFAIRRRGIFVNDVAKPAFNFFKYFPKAVQ